MIRRRLCALIVLGVASAARPAVAQQGRFVGLVIRDSTDAVIGGASVRLPDINRGATANYRGEFRFDDVPLGRHEVLVRHPGYAPVIDTVEITAQGPAMREFIMHPLPTRLDSVAVVGPSAPRYRTPGLRGFEARRKEGFGYFLDEDLLRKHDEADLSSVLARLPGLRLIFFESAAYATVSRNALGANVRADPFKPRSPVGCWVSVYLDGVRIYSVDMMRVQAPDFTKLRVADFAGVELYVSGSTVPPAYAIGDAGCGTLLLWTRER